MEVNVSEVKRFVKKEIEDVIRQIVLDLEIPTGVGRDPTVTTVSSCDIQAIIGIQNYVRYAEVEDEGEDSLESLDKLIEMIYCELFHGNEQAAIVWLTRLLVKCYQRN